jgi:lysine/ornithine N-monooxygenase
MEVGDQKDVQLNEAVGAMVHLVMNQNKKILEKFYEDHKDLTDEQKENERYSLIAQNLISFKIIVNNIIKEIFGDIDPLKLSKAEEDIHQLAMDTMNKSFKNKQIS